MTSSNKAVKIVVVYDDGEVVVFDAEKSGNYIPKANATSANLADVDMAFEATGNVAYNPETDSDVVAVEPPIIPVMRSGHEQPDL